MVYLVEPVKANIDLSTAEEFGDIEYVLDRRLSVYDMGAYRAYIIKRAKRFNPNEDYFCIAGSIVPVAITLAVLFEHFGFVKVLLYNSIECKYIARCLDGTTDEQIEDSIRESEGDAQVSVRSARRFEEGH